MQETEFDAAGNPTEKIVYTIGHDQISQTRYLASGTGWGEGSIAYFGTDGHGSVRVLYDATAAIVQAGIPQIYHFDAYGNLLNFADGTTPITSYLYSGEAFDFTIGQQYLRARWYDPTTGRFNRLDPFFGNQSDPQSFHKYAYVHGDPVNGVDPTGMFLSDVTGSTYSVYLYLRVASATLNTLGAVQNFTAAIQRAYYGDPLGAVLNFMFGAMSTAAAAYDIFSPLPGPPSGGATAGLALAVNGGRQLTGRSFGQIITHSPELAAWIYGYALPAFMRTSLGTVSVMFSEAFTGFQNTYPRHTDSIRGKSGTAHGGENLPSLSSHSGKWLKDGLAIIPREVADKLRGRKFTNWREFRETFWRTVYSIQQLRSEFGIASQTEMAAGRAPWVPKRRNLGARRKFEIDHMERLDIMGEFTLYDLENLMVVAPRLHVSF